MLGPLLLLQVAIAQPKPPPAYASTALASFIAAAAALNHDPPRDLRGYRAHIESELSLILRDTLGREDVAQVEELALEAQWRRDVDYRLHVIGYRSASVGVPYSALSFARGWTVPTLYGDRLTLGVDIARGGTPTPRAPRGEPAAPDSASHREREPFTEAVHPLAAGRERYYRFEGGDTIAFVRSATRVIPICRVQVRPVFNATPRDTNITLFEGEIEFDASRHQIVRMRGRFVTRAAPRRGLGGKLARLPGVVAVAFIEFVNAEVDGRYWLPQFQRTEFQATVAPLGTQRSVFRLVSRFSQLVADASPGVASLSDSIGAGQLAGPDISRDTTRERHPVLSYASGDSVSRYGGWGRPLGAATGAVSASDFDEYLPDAWKPSGPPRLEFAPKRLDEVFRFDRVEGPYSGGALALRFRDAAPGLTSRIYGGWAWSEKTLRGGASIDFVRGSRTFAARVERALVSTNDFAPPLDEGTIGFAGLFGADDQDYVDRRVGQASLTTVLGSERTGVLSIDAGMGDDHSETARVTHGAFGAGAFRLNRASAGGRYVRGETKLELHPNVTGLFLDPGAGLVASYEIARGQLNWQRAELTLSLRRNMGELILAARVQGGIVAGREIPPQQLFELGGESALPGYAYKQFAGDRAAAGGVLLSYPFPLLRRPWRLVRSLIVPGLSPGLALGIQSGWAEASSDRVLTAIRNLDPRAPASCLQDPTAACSTALSMPSGGARATVDARVTVFGGLLGFGLARPIERAAPWRLVFRFGQEY